MKVVFVRHGESEANVGNFINDDPRRPVNLTARGRAQASAAGEALRGFAFVRAYASQLPRAQQTAAAILAHHACVLEIDARINERISGMDGLPTSAFTELVSADPLHAKPPKGESFIEQMARMRAFLDHVAGHAPVGPVLAVSHENPILAASALAGRQPLEAALDHLPNCGWIEIEWPRP